jgi:hypothetical protein
MVRGKEFHPIIERIFGDVRGYLEVEQIQVNCPRCQEREGLSTPDGRYNLEINTAKRIFRCWKCDSPRFSGSLKRLIRLYGTKFDLEMYEDYGGDEFYSYRDSEADEEIGYVDLPKEYISFKNMNEFDILHTEAYKYMLLERQISKEIMYKYNLGFCVDGRYDGRIIVPSYDDEGRLNYFLARAFRKGMKPPYLNPKLDKDKIIFNEGLINWDSTIYIVEGVFEMFSFPINTVPMLGKTISKTMFMKLNEKKPPVVIILDPDAMKDAIEMFQKLQAIYVGQEDKLRIVELPGDNDLDEVRRKMGINKMNEYIQNARQLKLEDFFKFKKYEEEGKGYRTYSGYQKWR